MGLPAGPPLRLARRNRLAEHVAATQAGRVDRRVGAAAPPGAASRGGAGARRSRRWTGADTPRSRRRGAQPPRRLAGLTTSRHETYGGHLRTARATAEFGADVDERTTARSACRSTIRPAWARGTPCTSDRLARGAVAVRRRDSISARTPRVPRRHRARRLRTGAPAAETQRSAVPRTRLRAQRSAHRLRPARVGRDRASRFRALRPRRDRALAAWQATPPQHRILGGAARRGCRAAPPRPSGRAGSGGGSGSRSGCCVGSGASPVRICCSTRSFSGTTESSAFVYGCCGSVEDLLGRAELDDPAEVHHRDAVGDVPGQTEVVGDDEDRDPGLATRPSSSFRISPRTDASRLETGSSATSSRGSSTIAPAITHPLALPARDLVRDRGRRTAPAGADPQRDERLGDAALLVAAVSVDAQSLGDGLVDRLARVERAGRVLEHHLRLAAVRARRPGRS